MFGEGPTCGEDMLAKKDQCFKKAEQLVQRAAEQLQAAGFQTAIATIEQASEWHADLIVMGSHGRKGLDRFLLGSVAESVMRYASCSVEIVRLTSTTAPAASQGL